MIIDEAWAALEDLGLPMARDVWRGEDALPSAFIVVQEPSDVPSKNYDDEEWISNVYIAVTYYWSTPTERDTLLSVKYLMREAGFIRVSGTGVPFTESDRHYGYQSLWRKLDHQQIAGGS